MSVQIHIYDLSKANLSALPCSSWKISLSCEIHITGWLKHLWYFSVTAKLLPSLCHTRDCTVCPFPPGPWRMCSDLHCLVGKGTQQGQIPFPESNGSRDKKLETWIQMYNVCTYQFRKSVLRERGGSPDNCLKPLKPGPHKVVKVARMRVTSKEP